MVTARDSGNSPTEVKNNILSYLSIIKIMVDSHCEIMWDDNSGADLGHHPTENCAAGLDDTEKQSIIVQQRLRSNMLGLWINNTLTTDAKRKLMTFNYVNTFNTQDDGDTMFFDIVKKWCDLIHAQDAQTSIKSWKK